MNKKGRKIHIKSGVLIPIDLACIIVSYLLAAFIRNEDLMKELTTMGSDKVIMKVIFNPASLMILAFYMIFFILFDMYSTLLKHVTLEDAFMITGANICAGVLSIIYNYTLFPIFSGLKGANLKYERIPTGVVIMAIVFIYGFSLAARALPRFFTAFRYLYNTKHGGSGKARVIIYGAGVTGLALLRDFQREESKKEVVAFYDDDGQKTGTKLGGIRIYGATTGIEETARLLSANEIIIAVPTASKQLIQKVINSCKNTGCKIQKVPHYADTAVDANAKQQIKDIEIADLLGREEAPLDIESISGYISGSVVLVTGAGGSIGSELCRQIVKYAPKKLILLDIYENNVYDLENEFKRAKCQVPMETYIASVRDYKRMTMVFDREQPEIVFHAAAHKHVPLMEFSPGEAIKNNIFGTYNTATVAHEHNVKTFVLISTDKAVNPTNIMGATKRITEIIIQAYSKISKTRFVAVRFGNVLGSNGSVVPLFKRQIAEMGPVTVTHPEITRFFMTIPEAASLVVQAGAMAEGGEIFILDMGEPVKIDTLARDLIRLSGFVPDVDIKIEYTGLRPGEKLYEEILRDEEGVMDAKREGFYVAQPFFMEWNQVQEMMSDFEKCINGSHEEVARTLKKYIPTFTSKDI